METERMKPKSHMPDTPSSLLSVEEVAFLTGTTVQIIRRITRLELVRPVRRTPEPCFPPAVLTRVRRMLRMHQQLEVSWSSMALVLDLLERVDKLQTEVQRLRGAQGVGRRQRDIPPDRGGDRQT